MYERRRRNVKVEVDKRQARREGCMSVVEFMTEWHNIRTHNAFLIRQCEKAIEKLTEAISKSQTVSN